TICLYGLRTWFAGSGVCTCGTVDRRAAARDNHVLGNDPNATVIEILIGSFELEVHAPATIVFTGTAATVMAVDRRGRSKNATTNTILEVEDGDLVRLENADHGMRAYLAVRGGFEVPEVLGSAAT